MPYPAAGQHLRQNFPSQPTIRSGKYEKQAAAPALPADSCTGHELEVALPPAGKPLFGYDFLSRQCGYNDATVVFGAADGSKRLEIVLTDTGLPAPPRPIGRRRTSCAR